MYTSVRDISIDRYMGGGNDAKVRASGEDCLRTTGWHAIAAFAFGLSLAFVPGGAAAQDFGILESAETINRGNFKLKANPMVIVGQDGRDNELGISLLGGYGFTRTFDVEAGVALYDQRTYFGVNAELWLLRNRPVDVSASAGLHFGRSDVTFDTTGIDLTFLASGHVTPRLELFGALDFAFESFNEDVLDSYRTVHLVPGIEYRLTPDLDFLAEFGIGVNDPAWHYFSAGLAFYIR